MTISLYPLYMSVGGGIGDTVYIPVSELVTTFNDNPLTAFTKADGINLSIKDSRLFAYDQDKSPYNFFRSE